MGKTIDHYNFYDQYAGEWAQFTARFPEGPDLDKDQDALETREWCERLHRFVKALIGNSPDYSTQMEIYLHWKTLQYKLEAGENPWTSLALEWFTGLLVKMWVCDNSEVNQSIAYAIAVNYFECGMDGFWLLPMMYDQLPKDEQDSLVERSGSIDWEGKVDTYKRIADSQQNHGALLTALHYSCQAYCFGAIKAAEALPILKQLKTSNEHLVKETMRLLSDPVEVRILDHVELGKKLENGVCCFLSIEREAGFVPTWFPCAELWIGGECIQRLDHFYPGTSLGDLACKHGFEAPEGTGKVIGLPIPFEAKWLDEKVFLKPI